MIRGILLLLSLIRVLNSSCAHAEELTRHHEARYVMGTFLEITLFVEGTLDGQKLMDRAFWIATDLERVLTNYNPTSELSRINEIRHSRPIQLSTELAEFLSVSHKLLKTTQGAFDIGLRPVIELWQRASENGIEPSKGEIAKALRCVGDNYDVSALFLEKKCSDVRFDSGGIGKGYAVDKIATFLKKAGVTKALIHFGRSSTAAIGAPPGELAWRMVVKFGDEAPVTTLELNDISLSASDTLGRPMQVGEKKFAHIFDPSTGRPVDRRVKAYVLGNSATKAEAATKFVVLRGMPSKEQAAELGLREVFLEDENGRRIIKFN